MIVLQLLLCIIVLLCCSTFFSAVAAGLAGQQRFSLPFVNILLVTIVGAVLFPIWGWTSTAIILLIYLAFCVIAGLFDRIL